MNQEEHEKKTSMPKGMFKRQSAQEKSLLYQMVRETEHSQYLLRRTIKESKIPTALT